MADESGDQPGSGSQGDSKSDSGDRGSGTSGSGSGAFGGGTSSGGSLPGSISGIRIDPGAQDAPNSAPVGGPSICTPLGTGSSGTYCSNLPNPDPFVEAALDLAIKVDAALLVSPLGLGPSVGRIAAGVSVAASSGSLAQKVMSLVPRSRGE